ncbi:MAG TPA: hypothetical protein VEJ36_00845 [Nitrososphaerales archaeon]|nr:hypothetical protein [Nitrososphaerales archaeon]
MSQALEEAIKALKEFESSLDSIKAEAADSKKRIVKSASDWAESAKSRAITKARSDAEHDVARVRGAANKEAEKIKDAGEDALAEFKEMISKKKATAVDHVTKRLLGDSS